MWCASGVRRGEATATRVAWRRYRGECGLRLCRIGIHITWFKSKCKACCTPSSVTPVTEPSFATFIDVANSWPPPKPRATSFTKPYRRPARNTPDTCGECSALLSVSQFQAQRAWRWPRARACHTPLSRFCAEVSDTRVIYLFERANGLERHGIRHRHRARYCGERGARPRRRPADQQWLR